MLNGSIPEADGRIIVFHRPNSPQSMILAGKIQAILDGRTPADDRAPAPSENGTEAPVAEKTLTQRLQVEGGPGTQEVSWRKLLVVGAVLLAIILVVYLASR